MKGCVCALVLNWNAEFDTAACLASLLAQHDVTLEILLIDNASADGSGERLKERFPSVHYLQTGDNLGYAAGNNRGIEWAVARGASWLLVVNNDTVAAPTCVRRLLDVMESDDRIAALAPLITRFDDPARVWFAGGHFNRMRAMGVHENGNALVDDVAPRGDTASGTWRASSFVSGCCILLRADAISEVGGFRDDFFAYVEDVEISLRFARAGWKIGWVPSARLVHRVPPVGAPPSPNQIMLRDRNRRRLVRDEYSLGWKLLFALWFWPTRLVHLGRFAIMGDAGRARAVIAGMSQR